jgi:hypothetical protein
MVPVTLSSAELFSIAMATSSSLREGYDLCMAWGLTTCRADVVALQHPNAKAVIPSCVGAACEEEQHVCPHCYTVRVCGSFEEVVSGQRNYKVCRNCARGMRGYAETFEAIKTLFPDRVEKLLGSRLLSLLRRDRNSLKETSRSIGGSGVALEVVDEWWAALPSRNSAMVTSLQPFVKDKDRLLFWDNLIDQEIDTEKGLETWFGHRHNPFGASVDAYYSISIDADGNVG